MNTRTGFKIKLMYVMMALISLVAAYFFLADKINHLKLNEIQKNLEITKSNAGFIETLVMGKFKETVNLAENPDIIALDSKHLDTTLQTLKTSKNEDLFIAAKDGQILASTHTPTLNKIPQLNKNPHFEKALTGQPQIASQVRSVFTGDYVVTLYAPIINNSQKVIGVAGNELPMSFFQEHLAPVKIGNTGGLNLIDQDGYYLYGNYDLERKMLTPTMCYHEAKGQDISIVEKKCYHSDGKTIHTVVRLKQLDWYILAYQTSSELIAVGLPILVKDILVVLLLVITLVIMWLYKTALQNKNLLVRKQNAEKLALVGELAAGMAHEIRNPLTTVRGFCQLLKNTTAGQSHREIFDLIMQSVDHIDGIIKETLMLSKPQQIKLTKVNLQDILKDTCNFMISESLLREINLELELGSQEAFVIGDPVHLKQVLINIIKNSLEATPKHGTIKIRLERTIKQFAKILVSDTGPGIKSEIMDRIGTPFFTTKDDGTGLGLSVCKRIIEEHRGILKINSKEGFGTTICIGIPVIS